MTDPDYKMPYKPVIGETVLFSKDPKGNSGWQPAIVTNVDDRSVELFAPLARENAFRDNVRHATDPKWNDERFRQQALDDNESGVFKESPTMAMIHKLEARMAKFESAMLSGNILTRAPVAEAPPPIKETEPPKKRKGAPIGGWPKKERAPMSPEARAAAGERMAAARAKKAELAKAASPTSKEEAPFETAVAVEELPPHLRPAVYDPTPDGVEVQEIEEDDDGGFIED